MTCTFHPGVAAAAPCSQCQRPICSLCTVVVAGAPHCADCLGVRAAAVPARRLKSPFAAGFFSLVLPGLGQVYNGLVPRGLALFLIALVAVRLIADAGWFALLIVSALLVFWIWQVADAVGTAEDINRLGRVPDEEEAAALGRGPVPGLNGSRRTLGAFLVVAGILLLLEELEVARALMRFLHEAWPWLLVVGGGWLLWTSRKHHAPPAEETPAGTDAGGSHA